VAQALSRPEDLARRQEAIDQAIALQPHLVVAHEWRAFLLAEAGDTQAALAACRNPVFGEYPPAPLRARAAELEARCGNLESAVQEMTAALSLDPQQELWWSRLLYWLSGLDLDRYCQAARHYCNAVPGQPQAWWQLAEGLRARGMRAEAKEAFRRLLVLDPRAEIAAARLCQMYIEDSEIAAAHECLQSIRQHVTTPGAEVLACETRLHLARADWPAASGVLRTLCTTPADDSQTLRALADLAVANGRRRALLELLDVMLDAPDVQSSAAEVWGSLQVDWPERFQERLTELRNRPDLWQQAVAGYMAELARCGYRTLLSRFVDSHRDQLRAADFTWGAAGTSLLQLGFHDRAAQWLADWRQRDCLKDGVMLEAADAMFVTGRASEALAIHRSCESVDDPSMAVLHSLWLIAHALAHGKLAEAAPHCQRMMQQTLPPAAQDLGRFVETALAIEESWAGGGRGSFPQAKARLEATCGQCSVGGRQSRRLRTYYLQYLRRLAIRRGSLWQRLMVRLRLATAGRRRK
jgi:tetratricopeptide (TPR) repeat protein